MVKGRLEDNIVRQVIRRQWGDKLQPIPPARLAGKQASPGLRSFLTEVGLPTGYSFNIEFYRDQRLLALVPANAANFLLIAEGLAGVFAIRKNSEDLWQLSLESSSPECFVNSDLSSFLQFLGLYEAGREVLRLGSSSEFHAIMEELLRDFADYDKLAIEDSNHFWSIVLGEAQEGYP